MTDGYDCYQNAMAERINGILKNEFLLSRPADLAQAREMVKESVAIYNHERPHLALKYKTPDDVHQAFTNRKVSTYIRTSHLINSLRQASQGFQRATRAHWLKRRNQGVRLQFRDRCLPDGRKHILFQRFPDIVRMDI